METKRNIVVVIGTRPEAIKLAPVIWRLRKEEGVKTTVCIFRQHEKILDETLKELDIRPDLNLSISISDRALLGSHAGILKKAIVGMGTGLGLLRYLKFLKSKKLDLLIVQGDTSTACLAAWLAFHYKIKIAHVEAGLRTGNKYAPFPEEMNRVLLADLADIHFAPTEQAKQNLLREGIKEQDIHVVGNTAIDTLLSSASVPRSASWRISREFRDTKTILVTAHRRESFGEGLKNICEAVQEIARKHPDIKIVFPVHPNPNVQKQITSALKGIANIELCDPLPYTKMVEVMKSSYLILTDSGGIQEEAPSLGIPVLVMREETERTEGIEAGVSILVGTKKEKIVAETERLLENKEVYNQMARTANPYGDGKASERIVEVLKKLEISN